MSKIDIEVLFSDLIKNIENREDAFHSLRMADNRSKEFKSISDQYYHFAFGTKYIIDEIIKHIEDANKKEAIDNIVNKF